MTRIDVTACLHTDSSGKSFLTSMAQLAHMAGVSPEATAIHIHTGHSAELASHICAALTPELQEKHSAAMVAFIRKASLFTPDGSLEEIRCAVYHALAMLDDTPAEDGDPPPVFVPGEAAATEVLTHLVHLTTVLGYPPRIIARILHAGHFRELVQALYMDNRLRISMTNIRELNALHALSSTFVLPERFVRSPEALVQHVERIAGR